MRLEILELTDTKMKFIVSDVTPSFVNSLRRTLIADIPKMAIEDVEFHLGTIRDDVTNKDYESVSPLFDEIIAHRLGLLPIPTDLKLFKFRDECGCKGEGCPNCTIIYTLNKKGPCIVYSDDLEPLGDPSLKIVNPDIPITKLTEDQALLIYAWAVLGTGKEHAKWQVASGVGFKCYPSIEIDAKKCDVGGMCVRRCPKKVLKKEGERIIAENIEECNLCRTCEDVCELDAIKVEGDDTKYIFHFETDGSMSAETALKEALKILENKFNDFATSLTRMK